MKNIVFEELIFTKPGQYTYAIKELTPSGYGWTTDDRTYHVIITVRDNRRGKLIATAFYPNGKPQFTNVFSCIPTRLTLRAEKIICGICIKHLQKYDCHFYFGLYNEDGEEISTVANFEGMVTFPKLLFTSPGVYKYTIKELTQPFCSCWTTDSTVYPVEITVTPNADGRLEAHVYFPNGEPVFVNKFAPCRYCECDKSDKCTDCGKCIRYDQDTIVCI